MVLVFIRICMTVPMDSIAGAGSCIPCGGIGPGRHISHTEWEDGVTA